QTFLGRPPSPAEVAGWVGAFENGTSNEDIIAGFIGSAENFGLQGNNIDAWVEAAYQDGLGRPADPTEGQNWDIVIEEAEAMAAEVGAQGGVGEANGANNGQGFVEVGGNGGGANNGGGGGGGLGGGEINGGEGGPILGGGSASVGGGGGGMGGGGGA